MPRDRPSEGKIQELWLIGLRPAAERGVGGNRLGDGLCQHVMAYIPSLRVLREGGYEGESSMRVYGMPGLWAPAVEELIAAEAHLLARRLEAPPR